MLFDWDTFVCVTLDLGRACLPSRKWPPFVYDSNPRRVTD
jgi:hypothetical protein